MINDKITKQEGGDSSTNFQGQSIIVNQGITYEDAKNIAIDVFKANFLELSQKAIVTATERAEKLIDDFLARLKEKEPDALNSMEDPGMQYALFTAQKEFAKTGDQELADMLIDILVDRASQKERTLKQIVLDESLKIVPKLTSSQIDTLSIIFVLKYSRNNLINSIPSLKKYLETNIAPFIPLLSKELSLYQHLEFAGCASISLATSSIEEILLDSYKGMFCKGFTKEDFEYTEISLEKYPGLVTSCLHDAAKFQLALLDDEALITIGKALHIEEGEMNKLTSFMNLYQMTPIEVKEFLNRECEFMAALFEIWDTSSIKNMTITSVGIAIATANLRRKTGVPIDLGIWIK